MRHNIFLTYMAVVLVAALSAFTLIAPKDAQAAALCEYRSIHTPSGVEVILDCHGAKNPLNSIKHTPTTPFTRDAI